VTGWKLPPVPGGRALTPPRIGTVVPAGLIAALGAPRSVRNGRRAGWRPVVALPTYRCALAYTTGLRNWALIADSAAVRVFHDQIPLLCKLAAEVLVRRPYEVAESVIDARNCLWCSGVSESLGLLRPRLHQRPRHTARRPGAGPGDRRASRAGETRAAVLGERPCPSGDLSSRSFIASTAALPDSRTASSRR